MIKYIKKFKIFYLVVMMLFLFTFSTFANDTGVWNVGGWFEFSSTYRTHLEGDSLAATKEYTNGDGTTYKYPFNDATHDKPWCLPDRSGKSRYCYYLFDENGYILNEIVNANNISENSDKKLTNKYTANPITTLKLTDDQSMDQYGAILGKDPGGIFKLFWKKITDFIGVNDISFVEFVKNSFTAFNTVKYSQVEETQITNSKGDRRSFRCDCSGYGSACLWSWLTSSGRYNDSDFTGDVSTAMPYRFTTLETKMITNVGFSNPTCKIAEIKNGSILIGHSTNNLDASDHTIICIDIKTEILGNKTYTFKHMANRQAAGNEGPCEFKCKLSEIEGGKIKLSDIKPSSGVGFSSTSNHIYNKLFNPQD